MPQSYELKAILSPMEEQLYSWLKASGGDRCVILCKPQLSEFIKHGPERGAFNRISQKSVDFLICRPHDLTPMLAIELDDKTHHSRHRRQRDEFVNNLFAAIGLPLLRLPNWQMSQVHQICTYLNQAWSDRCLQLGDYGLVLEA